MTTVKRVSGLRRFGGCVFATAKPWRTLVQVRRVHFDHRKSCRNLGECRFTTAKQVEGLQRVGECVLTTVKGVRVRFDHRKA